MEYIFKHIRSKVSRNSLVTLLSIVLVCGFGATLVYAYNENAVTVLAPSLIKKSLGEENNNIQKIAYSEPQYAADFSDDRVLVGASHNIFVGTVIKQTGTKERGIGPETQFSVQIIDNIKGTLTGQVTVDEQDGYEDGTLYVVGDDSETQGNSKDDPYLLQPGSTYLFAARYNKEENWYTLNSYPTARALLTTETVGDDQMKTLIGSNARVKALEAAYPNEIPLKADVAHNNSLNSYSSIQQPEIKETESVPDAESADSTNIESSTTQFNP